MPKYLKKEYHTWYVRVQIPKDVRHAFQGKKNFFRSLKTNELKTAELLKIPFVHMIQDKIRAIREDSDGNLDQIALYHREQIKQAGHEEIREEKRQQALDDAVETFIEGGWKGVPSSENPDFYKVLGGASGGEKVLKLLDKIFDADSDTTSYLERWYNQYDVKLKTTKQGTRETNEKIFNN